MLAKFRRQVTAQSFECYRYVDDNTLIKSLFATETREGDHNTYSLIDFEYEPKIKYYPTYGVGATVVDRPALMVRRFDTFNIYEMFHSLLNTYLVIRMFDLGTDVLIVFNDTLGESSLNREMFEVFTDHRPLYSTSSTQYKFVNGFYEVPLSFTSILTTKTKHGSLRGRGNDHHCKSSLLRGFTEFWTERSKIEYNGGSTSPNIVWSSRGIHKRGEKTYVPSRALIDEREFIAALERSVGFHIRVVDFGLLTADESVRVAANADVLVGVHGAGLMWSAFMRPFDTGLVELFGGDRSAGNRHYHNVASLSGIGYKDIRHGLRMVSGSPALEWSGNTKLVSDVSDAIHKFVSRI